jgi:hypothetical protein
MKHAIFLDRSMSRVPREAVNIMSLINDAKEIANFILALDTASADPAIFLVLEAKLHNIRLALEVGTPPGDEAARPKHREQ